MMWKPYNYAKKRVRSCDANMPVSRVARMFADENMGSILVKDREGGYLGLLTDRVIFKAVASGADLAGKRAGDLSLEPIVRAPKDADFDEVSDDFKDSPSGRLALEDGKGRIVGVLKKKNIERFSIYKAASRMLKK